MRRQKNTAHPREHLVFHCTTDHLGFWIAYFRFSVGRPEAGAVDRLLDVRPDLDREAVVAIGYDVQSGMGQGGPWKSRHSLAAEDVRLVVEAYQRQHLAHLMIS